MPLTAAAKAIALDAVVRAQAPSASITHLGLLRWSEAGKSGTATASTDLVNITAHGYAAGDLLIVTALTGGTGLVLNDPYYVIAGGLVANAFAVSKTVGGTAVDITVDASAITVRRLVELTGGSPAYARKAVAWNAASAATESIDDSTNGAVFDIPAGTTVSWISGWNTAGTVRYFKKDVTDEVFGAQGTYTVTDADLDLNDA